VVAVLLDNQYTRRGGRAQIYLGRQWPAQKYQAAEDRSVRMPGRGIDVLFPNRLSVEASIPADPPTAQFL
jgi:hypothetical protein